MVYESDDLATRNYLATLQVPNIRTLEVQNVPKQPLGALRNLALQSARGRYVAQWDDDDWYAPNRIEEQLKALVQSGKAACVLSQWIIYDESTRFAYLSAQRTWEGSLLALRAAMLPYPALARGEDTPVIERLLAQGSLALLPRADLYVYVNHGSNTWGRAHFEQNLLTYAQALAPEVAAQVQKVLGEVSA